MKFPRQSDRGRIPVLIGMAVIVAGGGWWFFSGSIREASEESRPDSQVVAEGGDDASRLRGVAELPGAAILKRYGDPALRPEDDLHALARAFSNLLLLAKGSSPFRMGANEEFAAALMGKNAAHEVFLSPPHRCLNSDGQLVDRWGSPLFFHVRDASRIDLRSAGADRVMWTADDLHRRDNGEFVKGEQLPEESQR
jgi:hypothetical protein